VEPYAGFEPQVGEIRALRTFRIGPGGRLYPLFSNIAWVDGANAASCRMVELAGGAIAPHSVPDPNCTCGFYAYGSEAATAEYPHARHVLAVVSCWGHVIAGTRGLRAQCARIDALWVSDVVPADLVADVAQRYPSIALHRDKGAMLAEYPPSELDCYDGSESARPSGPRRWLSIGVAGALAVSAVPAGWWGGLHQARVAWAVAVGFFVVAALILIRGRSTDVAVRRRRVLFHAMALWMIAPFAGPIGLVLLRVPLLQLCALTLIQRRQMARAAGRFPAEIS
jgi:hypothetical protein